VSLVRFKTGLEEKLMVESMTVFNPQEVDTKKQPIMAFAPYCSLPELEACMKVWEFMEMIHSRSYTYIIKNVYSDPSEVFDTILSDDRIVERAVSVTEAYNDFINSAQHYGSTNEWIHALEQVPYAQEARYELKRKLFRAVANVNILEGIRFYVSFACSFAFGELKLMEGSAKIISLIARDENQHLVITQNILDISAKNNPLPWTEHWISSKGLQVAPQETEVESYIVGGIKQDVTKDTFSGFQL